MALRSPEPSIPRTTSAKWSVGSTNISSPGKRPRGSNSRASSPCPRESIRAGDCHWTRLVALRPPHSPRREASASHQRPASSAGRSPHRLQPASRPEKIILTPIIQNLLTKFFPLPPPREIWSPHAIVQADKEPHAPAGPPVRAFFFLEENSLARPTHPRTKKGPPRPNQPPQRQEKYQSLIPSRQSGHPLNRPQKRLPRLPHRRTRRRVAPAKTSTPPEPTPPPAKSTGWSPTARAPTPARPARSSANKPLSCA